MIVSGYPGIKCNNFLEIFSHLCMFNFYFTYCFGVKQDLSAPSFTVLVNNQTNAVQVKLCTRPAVNEKQGIWSTGLVFTCAWYSLNSVTFAGFTEPHCTQFTNLLSLKKIKGKLQKRHKFFSQYHYYDLSCPQMASFCQGLSVMVAGKNKFHQPFYSM